MNAICLRKLVSFPGSPDDTVSLLPEYDFRGSLPNYRGFSLYIHFSPWHSTSDSCQVCRIRRNWEQCYGWLFVKNVAFCEKHKRHPMAIVLLNQATAKSEDQE